MSLELHGSSGESVTVSEAEWYFILIFAEQYGWIPAGTLSPRFHNPSIIWDGQYDFEAGQKVTLEDSMEMAKALECALKDPYRKEIEGAVARHLSKVLFQVTGSPSQVEFPDISAGIAAVLELCRKGPFLIGSPRSDL